MAGQVPDRAESALKIIETLHAEVKQLRAALKIVPAHMLLQAGQPYRLEFTETELRQIATALESEAG